MGGAPSVEADVSLTAEAAADITKRKSFMGSIMGSGKRDTTEDSRIPVNAGSQSSTGKYEFGFPLQKTLTSGNQIILNANEDILLTWKCSSDSMSFAETVLNFITVGLYYFLTRVYLSRKRFYTLFITNSRFLIKEEMYERLGFFCSKEQMVENQYSYSHGDLAFVTAEETAAKFGGRVPAQAALELRFVSYPDWSTLSKSIYISVMAIIFGFLQKAFMVAFQKTYQIDLSAPPIKKIIQMIQMQGKLQDPTYAIYFGCQYSYEIFAQLIREAWNMLVAAFDDPSIGSLQAIGKYPYSMFRFLADGEESKQTLRKSMELIKAHCLRRPDSIDKPLFPRDTKSLVKGSIERVKPSEKPRNINNVSMVPGAGGEYNDSKNFVVHEEFLNLADDEVFLDVSDNNPTWTTEDTIYTVLTLGIYYFVNLDGVIDHRESYALTNKRLVRHSMLISPSSGFLHSRLDLWILPKKRSAESSWTIAKNQGKNMLCVNLSGFGMLCVFANHKHFLMNLCKTLLGSMENKNRKLKSDFSAEIDKEIRHSKIIKEAISSDETIEIALGARIPPLTCSDYLRCVNERNFMVITTKGIYIESYSKAFYFIEQKAFAAFLPWEVLDGVYWANYQSVSSFFGVKTSGQYSDLHGYSGALLRISVKNEDSIRFGVTLPSRFYGADDASVDALFKLMNEAMAPSSKV